MRKMGKVGQNGTKKLFFGSPPGLQKPIPCLLRCIGLMAWAGFGRFWQKNFYGFLPGRLPGPVVSYPGGAYQAPNPTSFKEAGFKKRKSCRSIERQSLQAHYNRLSLTGQAKKGSKGEQGGKNR